MSTTYLITGANRGLGRALVEAYLRRPNNIVVAAVRDATDDTTKALRDLPKAPSSSLFVVKIDMSSETDAARAMKELQSAHSITVMDTVIANAGIAKVFPKVEDAQTSDLLEHFHVNVIGNIVLFRAVLPLLRKSQKVGKFVTMASMAGAIAEMEKANVPNAVYGTSKAALNYVTKKIHLENEDIIAFPIHPGWVQTEMGNSSARSFGLERAPNTVEESVSGLMKVIEDSTRESTSGKFMSFDGATIAW
ncbi:uncharacterized protein Z519_01211 [Cladophialophora bantiana CBS 173.52]|uniref:Uncharacterized protein n=1 Tax=Cladophialophora bantiana (strain ATCC 10958 / CBS 173.52 / CDC B-1940 / NIH 8579) TaxID=1442370 RepID=A0A0D2GGZ5_CLAB1|nr:uncharacterized protein Z519_01211 [Cladophialophora bantiana CBS 173.52]KIW97627.1 hypothetical protein Z519_01211 [Cladophialophora bantiana CBS 173.52]